MAKPHFLVTHHILHPGRKFFLRFIEPLTNVWGKPCMPENSRMLAQSTMVSCGEVVVEIATHTGAGFFVTHVKGAFTEENHVACLSCHSDRPGKLQAQIGRELQLVVSL